MHRRVLSTLALVISVSGFPAVGSAQVGRDRDPNPALWQATPDGAALGSASRGFVEAGLTDKDNTWLGSVGFELGGGMLRASYGQRNIYHGSPYRDYALGYARQITEQQLGIVGSWSTGVDFTAAYQTAPLWYGNARAARLALPVSLRLGSPSRISLAPYVVPYAELGHATILNAQNFSGARTYSAGLGVGAELTVWRLGLTVGSMGVPRRLNLYDDGRWGASGSVRLGF